ncbi:cupredoxin domain-containing protein [Nitrosopumilus sp. S4]
MIGISLSYTSIKEISDDSELMIKGDVIMPTKVSRPGCEEIDRCYIPSVIEIEKGKQVTWINEDSAFHSVTSGFYESPSELFDSGYLDPFESYTLVFDEIGTYDYFCTLHPWMKGQVIVK